MTLERHTNIMLDPIGNLDTILIRRPTCEICWQRPSEQLHHAIIHDMRRYHKILTVEINLQPVCSICHTSPEQVANSFENRQAFVMVQIERGFDVGAWIGSLPLKYIEDWLLRL
jgi:hypothetical protein